MTGPITTRSRPKSFAWSYSKLKNFEVCPFRHQQVDIVKSVKEEESDQLLWGNAVHKALADAIGKGVELPTGMSNLQQWVDRFNGTGAIVEQKYAITKDFGKTDWFANNAWYRGIGDVVNVGARAGVVVDWKTGKILEDSCQLALMAACLFAHYPTLQVVRSVFVWLKEDAETTQDFKREDMPKFWADLWPRIQSLEHAHDTGVYPKTPGRLCKNYCPVNGCEHYGT